MRRAAKVDLNQKQIVEQLRAAGFSVRHTHTIGKGFPDLAVGKWGLTLLVEVKREGEGLTLDEQDFFDSWWGAAMVAKTAGEVIDQLARMADE